MYDTFVVKIRPPLGWAPRELCVWGGGTRESLRVFPASHRRGCGLNGNRRNRRRNQRMAPTRSFTTTTRVSMIIMSSLRLRRLCHVLHVCFFLLSVQASVMGDDAIKVEDVRPDVRYHLYDPSEFDMYRNCPVATSSHAGFDKHSVDRLFVEQLVAENRSVPPEQAEVFVVPAIYTESVRGLCGNHAANHEQLVRRLRSSPHFLRSNGTDHVLVAGDWKAREHLDKPSEQPSGLEMTAIGYFRGNFEHVPSFSVGYGTTPAMARLWRAHDYSRFFERELQDAAQSRSRAPIVSRRVSIERPELVPWKRRGLILSAIMQLDNRHGYRDRRDFWCSWATLPDRIRATDGYDSAAKKRAIAVLRRHFFVVAYSASASGFRLNRETRCYGVPGYRPYLRRRGVPSAAMRLLLGEGGTHTHARARTIVYIFFRLYKWIHLILSHPMRALPIIESNGRRRPYFSVKHRRARSTRRTRRRKRRRRHKRVTKKRKHKKKMKGPPPPPPPRKCLLIK